MNLSAEIKKKGLVQNHKSKCRVRRKVQSWIWSLNLNFKRREEKKVPFCVISNSFLCRGKHSQILESVTTCQNLSKTWKHNICFICLESLGNIVLLFNKSSTNFLRSKCPIKKQQNWPNAFWKRWWQKRLMGQKVAIWAWPMFINVKNWSYELEKG